MKVFTREQYMNNEVSHHKYYAQFVTPRTLEQVRNTIGLEALRASEDGHFNDVKLPFNNMGRGGTWWWDTVDINQDLCRVVGENNSHSTHTCVGKAAARILLSRATKA